MRSLFRPFEQINSEQLVKRLYNFASPIDDAAPASSTISFNRDQSQMLQVVALQPVGHALDVAWTVDGVDAGTGPDLTLSGSLLAAGTHVVEAVVRDRTPLVRNDPIGLLSESRRWTVTVTGSTGSAATATFVRIDATTQGTWRSNYGRDGATVVADAAADPAYARTGPSGEATYAWETVTADGRALQRIADASRLAATWYGDAFTIDVNLTDGQAHQLALYTVDWDHGGRVQRVDVRDAVTGALLDTRTQSAFDDGQYLVWHVTGHVVIQLTRLAGFNAVVSGLFLDPITVGGSAATATFVRVDATTQGTWRGTFGRDGATVVADAAADPAYARTGPSGEATYAWETVTADGRALQRITDASRLAATWYGDAFAIDVNLTDGQPHQLALYSVDWDHGGRMQRVDVRDAVTGALLDTRTQSAFDDGQYLVWHVTGHVVIQLTRLAGFNAVVSGLFLDPITAGGSAATATFVGVDATTQGTWRAPTAAMARRSSPTPRPILRTPARRRRVKPPMPGRPSPPTAARCSGLPTPAAWRPPGTATPLPSTSISPTASRTSWPSTASTGTMAAACSGSTCVMPSPAPCSTAARRAPSTMASISSGT